MQLKFKSLAKTKIKYYQHGLKPNLLILTGLHGDEAAIIDGVKKSIYTYLNQLPPFLFIPEASPSAVRQKTRVNKDQIDINRQFFEQTKIDEIKIIMQIIKQYYFDLSICFHEDLQQTKFYLYDSGNYQKSQNLKLFKKEIKTNGILLLNGIDDADDPNLGHKIYNGYCSLSNLNNKSKNGTFDSWALRQNIVKRILTPEIPGRINIKIKYQIIDIFFRHLIIRKAT